MNENHSTTQPILSPQRRLDEKTKTFLRIKRRFLKHIWLARILGLTLFSVVILTLFSLSGVLFERLGFINYTNLAANFILAPESRIKSAKGGTNIVVLGKAGEGHSGGDLTDTIIFVSVGEGSTSLVSLPRDIWIPEIRAKINSAYYWGNQKQPEGGGIILTKSLVEQIVGVPIHYAAVFDFSIFKKLIDAIGGITVDVEREFVDMKYPIPGREKEECGGDLEYKCRYETLHFVQGKKLMDGETALKFVRSRNADGDEGTDIAREARQQKVIAAIKEKIVSPLTLVNPRRLFAVVKVIQDSVETDIRADSAVILLRKFIGTRNNVKTHVLPEEFLENPPISTRYDNQYVFIPADGNWESLHAWIEEILK